MMGRMTSTGQAEAEIRAGRRWTVPAAVLPAWSAAAAFGAYFCMYGFRKPFTASTYEGAALAGADYKTLLVVSQVLGYMASKFVGIRVIAEMPAARRAAAFLTLIGGAEAALLLFAVVPRPYNVALLFGNGLCLGMVFGLVLGFLEGRRVTEALTAALCASFILADGATKSVGALLLGWGVAEAWMPAVAGLVFVPPTLLFVWMLARIPAPSAADVQRRQERVPMSRGQRREFVGRWAGGLVPLVVVYLLITILRSVRADFAPELWQSLGFAGQPGIFTQSELVVAAVVISATALSVLIQDNRAAFFTAVGASLAGAALVGGAAVAVRGELIGGFAFMVLVGLGVYLPYVAFHTTIFERLIPLTQQRGNLGFLMYVADAFGYLGYVAVMFGRLWFRGEGDLLGFFSTACLAGSGASVVLLVVCWRYFAARPARSAAVQPAVEPL